MDDSDLTRVRTDRIICIVTQMSKRAQPFKNCTCSGEQLAGLLQAGFFKALCDPARINILLRLAHGDGPSTVGQVASCCPTDVSVVSRHLAILREAGILACERRGKECHYTVRYPELVAKLRAMADALEACCPATKPAKKRGRHE